MDKHYLQEPTSYITTTKKQPISDSIFFLTAKNNSDTLHKEVQNNNTTIEYFPKGTINQKVGKHETSREHTFITITI